MENYESEIYLTDPGDFKRETYLIFGAKNKIQPNDVTKCEFRPVHWDLYVEYFEPDVSYYESIKIVDEVTNVKIYYDYLWSYNQENAIRIIQKYAVENRVDILFSFPTKNWIIKKFENMRWCQLCNEYPCDCGERSYRKCAYIYKKEW